MSPTPLLVLLASYLMGAVPFGFLLGRWWGVDVRSIGSGNIGATNVMRATGRRIGLLTFFLDAAKGAAGPLLAVALGLDVGWVALAGLAAVVGHCFPAFMGFRGGKGVATLAGVFAILNPLVTAASGVVFALTLALFRYVALSSAFLALALAAGSAGWHGVRDPRTIVALAAAGLVAARHKDNWVRMWHGTEGRVFEGEPGGTDD
jgi:glycerol-3-phosphate acyltransferase PlsY